MLLLFFHCSGRRSEARRRMTTRDRNMVNMFHVTLQFPVCQSVQPLRLPRCSAGLTAPDRSASPLAAERCDERGGSLNTRMLTAVAHVRPAHVEAAHQEAAAREKTHQGTKLPLQSASSSKITRKSGVCLRQILVAAASASRTTVMKRRRPERTAGGVAESTARPCPGVVH